MLGWKKRCAVKTTKSGDRLWMLLVSDENEDRCPIQTIGPLSISKNEMLILDLNSLTVEWNSNSSSTSRSKEAIT